MDTLQNKTQRDDFLINFEKRHKEREVEEERRLKLYPDFTLICQMCRGIETVSFLNLQMKRYYNGESPEDVYNKLKASHASWVCEKCKAIADRRKRITELLKGVNVLEKYQQCTFDNYRAIDKDAKENLRKARKAINNQRWPLLIYGPNGCGKTHLAVAIFKEKIIQGHKGWFESIPWLYLEVRNAFGPKPVYSELEIVKKYTEYKILILDDLGQEKPSEYSRQTLYLILDRRANLLNPTIITSNKNLDEIEKFAGQSIASRIAEGRILEFKGKDYRTRRDKKE